MKQFALEHPVLTTLIILFAVVPVVMIAVNKL